MEGNTFRCAPKIYTWFDYLNDLFLLEQNADFADYVDDKTIYKAGDNIDEVFSLQSSEKRFNWLPDNQMKSNKGKCHFGRDSQEWIKKICQCLDRPKLSKKKKSRFLKAVFHQGKIRSRGFSIKSSSSERLSPFMQQSK